MRRRKPVVHIDEIRQAPSAELDVSLNFFVRIIFITVVIGTSCGDVRRTT